MGHFLRSGLRAEVAELRVGLADYLGWKWKSKVDIPIVCVPGCPVQPDNFMETLLYLLYMAAGRAPMIPLDEGLRPAWLFGQTVHEGCEWRLLPSLIGLLCKGTAITKRWFGERDLTWWGKWKSGLGNHDGATSVVKR